MRLCCTDQLAAGNHPQRRFDADQARQALGAAGAGDDPERDFRKANPRRRISDAVMGTKGELESAAGSNVVDCRNDRLAGRLKGVDHRVQIRRTFGRAGVEFPDVGAGTVHAASTGDDKSTHVVIGERCLH